MRRLHLVFSSSLFRLGLGLALGAACLWLAFQGISLTGVASNLARIQWGWVAAALAAVIAANYLKAVRWQLLYFPQQHRHSLRQLFGILMIGQTLNTLVPVARLGELARLYLLGVLASESKSRTLGTIALEKITDLCVLMAFVGMMTILPFLPVPAWLQSTIAPGLLGLGLLVLTSGLVLFQERRLLEWGRAVARRFPRLEKWNLMSSLELALSTLAALRDLRVHAALWAFSIVIWLLSALINYFIFRALNLGLGFAAAMVVLAVLQVGVTVPSAPGKVGVFQYLCVLALAIFNVPREGALAYGVLLYGVVVLPVTLLGSFGLILVSLKLRPASRAETWRMVMGGGQ